MTAAEVAEVAELAGRAHRLVAAHPPATTTRGAFLAAQFDAGLAWVHFAYGCGGLDTPLALQRVVDEILHAAGAPSPIDRSPIAHRIVAPILAAHGNEAQRARLKALFVGDEQYCQLFSEPGAGSDLAAVATRAERADDEWRVTGQKVWTSGAREARWGLALVRTGAIAARHRAVTLLLVDMTAPGVTIRPIRQLTGDAEFNEVYLDGVRVPDGERLGPVDGGWALAMATLAEERRNIGYAPMYTGGDVIDHALAAWRNAAERRPTDRAALTQVVARRELLRRTCARVESAPELRDRLTVAVKLLGSELTRDAAELLANLQGSAAMLYPGGYDRPASGAVYRYEHPTQFLLRTRAATIAGGTSELMRTLIAERTLGLPRADIPTVSSAPASVRAPEESSP